MDLQRFWLRCLQTIVCVMLLLPRNGELKVFIGKCNYGFCQQGCKAVAKDLMECYCYRGYRLKSNERRCERGPDDDNVYSGDEIENKGTNCDNEDGCDDVISGEGDLSSSVLESSSATRSFMLKPSSNRAESTDTVSSQIASTKSTSTKVLRQTSIDVDVTFTPSSAKNQTFQFSSATTQVSAVSNQSQQFRREGTTPSSTIRTLISTSFNSKILTSTLDNVLQNGGASTFPLINTLFTRLYETRKNIKATTHELDLIGLTSSKSDQFRSAGENTTRVVVQHSNSGNKITIHPSISSARIRSTSTLVGKTALNGINSISIYPSSSDRQFNPTNNNSNSTVHGTNIINLYSSNSKWDLKQSTTQGISSDEMNKVGSNMTTWVGKSHTKVMVLMSDLTETNVVSVISSQPNDVKIRISPNGTHLDQVAGTNFASGAVKVQSVSPSYTKAQINITPSIRSFATRGLKKTSGASDITQHVPVSQSNVSYSADISPTTSVKSLYATPVAEDIALDETMNLVNQTTSSGKSDETTVEVQKFVSGESEIVSIVASSPAKVVKMSASFNQDITPNPVVISPLSTSNTNVYTKPVGYISSSKGNVTKITLSSSVLMKINTTESLSKTSASYDDISYQSSKLAGKIYISPSVTAESTSIGVKELTSSHSYDTSQRAQSTISDSGRSSKILLMHLSTANSSTRQGVNATKSQQKATTSYILNDVDSTEETMKHSIGTSLAIHTTTQRAVSKQKRTKRLSKISPSTKSSNVNKNILPTGSSNQQGNPSDSLTVRMSVSIFLISVFFSAYVIPHSWR